MFFDVFLVFIMITQDALREPTYYSVYNYVSLSVDEFKLPRTYGSYVYLVEFGKKNLEIPDSDPLCMYYYAGVRKFIWRNQYWNEVILDWCELYKKIVEIDDCELSRLWNHYLGAPPPLPSSKYDDDRLYCRAIIIDTINN